MNYTIVLFVSGGLMFLVEDAATLEELEAKHEGAQQSRNSAQFDRSTMGE
jgi:hypothetical protein